MSEDLVPVTGRTGPIRVGVTPSVVPVVPRLRCRRHRRVGQRRPHHPLGAGRHPRARPGVGRPAGRGHRPVPRRLVHRRAADPSPARLPRRGQAGGHRGARHDRRPRPCARRVRPADRGRRAAPAARRADEHQHRPSGHVHGDGHQPRQRPRGRRRPRRRPRGGDDDRVRADGRARPAQRGRCGPRRDHRQAAVVRLTRGPPAHRRCGRPASAAPRPSTRSRQVGRRPAGSPPSSPSSTGRGSAGD